jgi:aryl-alcohol dehydrogenase-like predicted oxidoreductase
VPIPNTSKLHRLDENIGAARIELTTGTLGSINLNRVVVNISVQGARYSEHL